MAFVVKDRVKELSTSNGTGVVVLNGAIDTFFSFYSSMSDLDTFYYSIVNRNANEAEVGLGQFQINGAIYQIERLSVIRSSNGNNFVDFSNGSKEVTLVFSAEQLVSATDMLPEVQVNGSVVGSNNTLNFIAGGSIGISGADSGSAIDITVSVPDYTAAITSIAAVADTALSAANVALSVAQGVQTSVAANTSAISVLQTSVAAVVSTTAILQTSVAAAVSLVGVLQTSLAATQVSLAAATSSIAVIQTSLAANTSAISVLQTSVASNNTALLGVPFRTIRRVAAADSPVAVTSASNGLLFLADTSAGNIIFNLAAVTAFNSTYSNIGFKKETSDTNSITINVSGTDTFDDGTTSKGVSVVGGFILSPNTSVTPHEWVTRSINIPASRSVLLSTLAPGAFGAYSTATNGSYTLSATDDIVYVSAAAATVITPASAALMPNKIHVIEKVDSTTNSVSVVGIGTLYSQGEALAIQSNGTSWPIIWRRIPGYLGTQNWTNTEANCSTTVYLFREGPRLTVDGRSVATGVFSGSNFQVTIPAEFTPDSTIYVRDNTNGISVDLGVGNVTDFGTAQYQASVRLVEGNNIRIQVVNTSLAYATYAAINATTPMTWASGDRIIWRAEFAVSGWGG